MINSDVIGCNSASYSQNQVVYFKKTFYTEKGTDFNIKIFADARYKLYINGVFVSAGPAKGNDMELFYDELKLSEYLTDGENKMEIRILCLALANKPGEHRFITSLRRSGTAALQIEGMLGEVPFVTDASWECGVCLGISFFAPTYGFYTAIPEHITSNEIKYEKARILVDKEHLITYGEPHPWLSRKNLLPVRLFEERSIALKAGEVFEADGLMSAYLKMRFVGKGRVKITYAERYSKEGNDNRTDRTGELKGDLDIIEVDGELVFEPFWFRVFRFLKIETEGSVEIREAFYYEAGYPLNIADNYDFGSDRDNKLWEISLRTLKRCMYDTFVDCPYYEQLQYAMDTYLQCIFAYRLTPDYRLQKKAVRDFAMSISGDGLTQSRSPSTQKQFIPGFALFYIMMVLYHYDVTDDPEFLEENIPQIIRVLNWYKRNSNADGLVIKSKYWHFIDWADDYEFGCAPAEEGATQGIESLMCAYVMKKLSRALENTVYESYGKECLLRSKRIAASAEEKYYCEENGLYANTEHKKYFSQHMQIWAVLTGLATGDKAKSIMIRSFDLKGAQSTFAYSYFLFRALEKADVYELRKGMLNKYRELIDFNCSTVPETIINARSECHAWGAIVLYEFTAMDLGVCIRDSKIIIKPYVKEREYAKGTVYTKYGAVYVSWRKRDGKLYIYTDADNAIIEENGVMPQIVCKTESETER